MGVLCLQSHFMNSWYLDNHALPLLHFWKHPERGWLDCCIEELFSLQCESCNAKQESTNVNTYMYMLSFTLGLWGAYICIYIYIHACMCPPFIAMCMRSVKAMQDCRVNPCSWSSNKSRPHLSTYIHHYAIVLVHEWLWRAVKHEDFSQTKGANGLQFSLKEEVLASNNLFLHKSG